MKKREKGRNIWWLWLIAIATICFASVSLAQAVPGTPVGVCGFVYLSDGITQAPYGTNFSVNDTTSGFYKNGTTGFGPFPGVYFVMISGNYGDTVIVKAWNETTHYGEITVTLDGVMKDVDVVIDTPVPKSSDDEPLVTILPVPVNVTDNNLTNILIIDAVPITIPENDTSINRDITEVFNVNDTPLNSPDTLKRKGR